MAKCIAESLLVNDLKFNGIDMRGRYLLWWNFGYCNGRIGESYGLGTNIK